MNASYDPNFPPGLCIQPNNVFDHVSGAARGARPDGQGTGDEWEQAQSIRDYGIAGRVWSVKFACAIHT